MAEKYYAEIFKQNGASYHQAMQLQTNARDQEFLAALSYLELKKGDNILDVPAGGGYLKAYLPDGLDYLGYDFAGAFGHGQTNVTTCDETLIELPNNSVDNIICLAALHHVEDRLGFYQELKRILKPEGKLIIGDILQHSPQDAFLNNFVDQWNSLGHQGDFLQPQREQQELVSVGFRSELTQENFDWIFSNREQARDYFRLLFSMDKHPEDSAIDDAMEKLGTKSTSTHFYVNWCLGFISATISRND
ncbi:class I SAM-dependent methyltransferase [Arenicella xantha]|uniref:Methyltransferase family protein n=1 Tax=Arenicella xantha TaxID=644221 RepID=A0A395JQY4_9GAMM|nr:class I SAM-dependent methyltransferase [Arenicella xantha]RBP52866.1 methyltransferase family protein [Arenicella xantha]